MAYENIDAINDNRPFLFSLTAKRDDLQWGIIRGAPDWHFYRLIPLQAGKDHAKKSSASLITNSRQPMKNLWTPWRMAYIQGKEEKKEGCIFDAAVAKPHDKEALILFRDQLTVVLLNRFPYANGHLLVAPARHVRDILDLEQEEASALMERIKESVAILRRHVKPHGFNIGLNLESIAGAGLAEHLHFHIVPRWDGDHNFMTIVAGTRTVPELLADTFERLLPDFQALLPPAGAESCAL